MTTPLLPIHRGHLIGIGEAHDSRFSIHCVGCDRCETHDGTEAGSFITALNSEGWGTKDQRTLCPDCVADKPRRIAAHNLTSRAGGGGPPYLLTCTTCDKTETSGYAGHTAAKEYTSKGWRKTDKQVWCPSCASRPEGGV